MGENPGLVYLSHNQKGLDISQETPKRQYCLTFSRVLERGMASAHGKVKGSFFPFGITPFMTSGINP